MLRYLLSVLLLITGTVLSADPQSLCKFDPAIVDSTVNPRDDFYHFASGLWLKNATKPEGVGRFGYYNQADAQIKRDLINLFNGQIGYDSSNRGAGLVTYLYRSGTDTVTLNNLGVNAISDQLEMIDSVQSMAELQKALTKFVLVGVNPFFKIYRPKSYQILDINYMNLWQTSFGLSDIEDFTDDTNDPESKAGQYKILIKKLLNYVIEDKSKIDSYTESIISLEAELASQMMNSSEQRNFNKIYNTYKIDDLNKMAPRLDWNLILSGLGIPVTQKIVIGQPEYFRKIDAVFQIYNLDILKTYLKFVLIYRKAPLLSDELRQTFLDFKIQACGWKKISRETTMSEIITRDFADLVGTLFLEEYFPLEKKKKVMKMIANLKTALENNINRSENLSDSFKNMMIRKLKNMKFLVGGSGTTIEYDQAPDESLGFISNLFAARGYFNKRYLSQMGLPKDYEAWTVGAFSTNAWYSPERNRITLPAGNINEFWSDDDAWNYGTLGATIAHEMTHGFDRDGRTFDENGQPISFCTEFKSWWYDDDKHFNGCLEQLQTRYDRFVVLDSFHVDGEKTLNENVADLGGLGIAYDAYVLAIDGKESENIGGFSGPQRFFLSYAQKWRELFDNETLIRSLGGYHAPPQYRTNGVVYNIPGFYDAFGITPSGKMYLPPEKRISIW